MQVHRKISSAGQRSDGGQKPVGRQRGSRGPTKTRSPPVDGLFNIHPNRKNVFITYVSISVRRRMKDDFFRRSEIKTPGSVCGDVVGSEELNQDI